MTCLLEVEIILLIFKGGAGSGFFDFRFPFFLIGMVKSIIGCWAIYFIVPLSG
jgi:hypothetical protein